jgi:hypothetical protein
VRRFAFLSAAILILAANAAAQLNSAPASGQLYAMAVPAEPALAMPALPALASAAPAEPPQGVYGVLQNYEWQIYGGYTYVRFYMLPNAILNMNGFNVSAVYYPHGGWVGGEGEMVGTFASQSTRFALYMGGIRLRWSKPRALEVWAHGLAGGAHESPQTPYGSQSAFGFEGGGGIDINAHHRRMAYRIEGDVLGTRFFGTYQYSPKISVGIVYKF